MAAPRPPSDRGGTGPRHVTGEKAVPRWAGARDRRLQNGRAHGAGGAGAGLGGLKGAAFKGTARYRTGRSGRHRPRGRYGVPAAGAAHPVTPAGRRPWSSPQGCSPPTSTGPPRGPGCSGPSDPAADARCGGAQTPDPAARGRRGFQAGSARDVTRPRPAAAPRARENAAVGAAALRAPRARLQQGRQEAALCAPGTAAGPPQPQPGRGGHGPAQQDQPLHPRAAPRHHRPGPGQALPALREDCFHQSHPGQDNQQVQRLRLRRLRQPHGGSESGDGAEGQRGAGADGQAAGAGPHQPVHLEPAAGGGRAGAGGAAETLRDRGVHPHPARPPRGQPRRGLRTDGIHGEVRGRHHPLQREVHQDAPGGASPPRPAALQVRGRGAEEAAEPEQVRAQWESVGAGRRHEHRDLGLRPRDSAAERVLPGALWPGPQPHDRPPRTALPALPGLLLPGSRPRLDAPIVPRAAHGRGAGPRCGPRRPPPALRGGPPGPAARPPLAGQRRHVRPRCRRPRRLHPAVPAGAACAAAGGRQRRPSPRPHRVAVRTRRLPLPLPQVVGGGWTGTPPPPPPLLRDGP